MRHLRLKRMRKNRRGVRYGFPVGMTKSYMQRLVGMGRTVLVIREREHEQGGGGARPRLPVCRYSPVATCGWSPVSCGGTQER